MLIVAFSLRKRLNLYGIYRLGYGLFGPKMLSTTSGRMLVGALGIPSFMFFLVTCGVLPRPFQVVVSAIMHKVKRTHSRKPSQRKFNYDRIQEHLVLGRQPRNEQDIDTLIEKEGVRVFVTLNEVCLRQYTHHHLLRDDRD